MLLGAMGFHILMEEGSFFLPRVMWARITLQHVLLFVSAQNVEPSNRNPKPEVNKAGS